MNKFKKMLNTLKYLPIVVLPFLAQDLKGQVIHPKGVLNPFIPQDTTEAAKAYEKITTQSGRNSEIFKRVRAGWVYTIPTNTNPNWDCNERERQQIVNSMNCTGVYNGGKLLFNGYKDFDFTFVEIYKNGGTLFSTGDDCLPMLGVEFEFYNNGVKVAHAINGVISGNDAKKNQHMI